MHWPRNQKVKGQGHTVTKTVKVVRLLVTRAATAVCCCCRRVSACRYDCLGMFSRTAFYFAVSAQREEDRFAIIADCHIWVFATVRPKWRLSKRLKQCPLDTPLLFLLPCILMNEDVYKYPTQGLNRLRLSDRVSLHYKPNNITYY